MQRRVKVNERPLPISRHGRSFTVLGLLHPVVGDTILSMVERPQVAYTVDKLVVEAGMPRAA
jgi:hypothetical protein